MKRSQKLKLWQEHLSQWQSTNISQAAYCRQHDLKHKSFSYYKRKFSETVSDKRKLSPTSKISQPPAFIQVALPQQPSIVEPLIVELSNGIRLSGIASSNISLVKQLSEVLS